MFFSKFSQSSRTDEPCGVRSRPRSRIRSRGGSPALVRGSWAPESSAECFIRCFLGL